jgi:excinuclease ABC subunit A
MLQSKKESLREIIEPFLDVALCPECVGERIGPEGRNVLIADKRLPELIALPIAQTRQFLADWSIPPDRLPIAHPLVLEIQRRLDFLIDVGVGYIELDRPVASLSGGEAQRIRLASSIGSGLDGACFVLDEPTSGLHPRDTDRLLDLLTQLRDRGNSVLVVEHDPAAMARADWIIDIGPGAGVLGGQVVHEGTRDSFQPGQGLTADYLGGARTILPEDHQPSPVPQSHPQLSFTGVRHRNLQEIDVSIPLCRFVAVTGVSGSGKSTLVTEVIVPAVRQALGKVGPAPGAYREMIGVEAIADLVEVDQAPIGRTPRSCPASFCGAWDAIRHVFARTRDAKLRGFKAGRFSFNSPQGACPACRGLGHRRVRMGFLPDAFVLCETCRGRRFNPSTLAIKYRDQSPADILAMNVAQAVAFFVNHPRVLLHLQPLVEVGLGYLTLGQSATTLSGGEAQRLKLATHLADRRADSTLYVLDEPTTGLHLDDIRTLLAMLLRLVVRGASVLVIEHHTGVIAAADWIIDLGPEGGAKGGRVLAHGTPADVAQTADTPTARALRNHLQLPHRPAPPSVHP